MKPWPGRSKFAPAITEAAEGGSDQGVLPVDAPAREKLTSSRRGPRAEPFLRRTLPSEPDLLSASDEHSIVADHQRLGPPISVRTYPAGGNGLDLGGRGGGTAARGPSKEHPWV
jgi:hypothetical protein